MENPAQSMNQRLSSHPSEQGEYRAPGGRRGADHLPLEEERGSPCISAKCPSTLGEGDSPSKDVSRCRAETGRMGEGQHSGMALTHGQLGPPKHRAKGTGTHLTLWLSV